MAEETPFQKLVKDSRPRAARPGPGRGNRRGRVHGSRVSSRDREAMFRIYRETGNVAETARRTGWEYGTVWKHVKAAERDNLAGRALVDIGPPKNWDELTEQERGWLVDFGSFRRHFLRRETPPFHQQIADTISQGLYPKIQVLCPPGHGKTQCFSVDYPIWEMIRQRTMGPKRENWDGWGCLLISAGDKLAKAFLSQIKHELEQNTDLQLAYGRFKPEYPDQWSQFQVTVEGFPIRKEATFTAAGAKSRIYGWRPHLIIGDDIVDDQNCFSGDTRFLTRGSTTTMKEAAGSTVEVLTNNGRGHGRWVAAEVKSFGYAPLVKIGLDRLGVKKEVFATANHRWLIKEWQGRGQWALRERTTSQLSIGDRLPILMASPRAKKTALSPFGVAHGITFGDGHLESRGGSAAIHLIGEKNTQLLPWFGSAPSKPTPIGAMVRNLPRFFKRLPDLSESASYLLGWLAGYFAADGSVDQNGWPSMVSAERHHIEIVRDICNLLGIGTNPIATRSYKDSWTGAPRWLSSVSFVPDSLPARFFLVSEHRRRFENRRTSSYRHEWKVESVESTDRVEEVFCPVVPATERFALEDNILTMNSNTPEKAAELDQWHADILTTRLEPGGVVANIGTRFSMFDLHGKLIRKRDDDGEVLWHPILYRAHDDSQCSGTHCMECKERCVHDRPWPEGCLLWPGRFSYRKLRSIRSGSTTTARFEFLYQQYEVPDEGALVKPEWSEKCKNTNRLIWDIPQGTKVMCTLDPSPTKWAVAQCWALGVDGITGEERHYFVNQWRKKRTMAPEYLALMRDWTKIIRSKGKDPIWVFEINAAQRWLLHSTEYQMMRAELGMTVIPHTTGRNKADPEYGIQCLGPLYEFQRVDLPWGDAESKRTVQALLDELHAYDAGETDDCVMAHWFYSFNKKRLTNVTGAQFYEQPFMPPYLLKTRALVDTHSGQRTEVS